MIPSKAEVCSWKVADWETFLLDRRNTREIPSHCGGSPMGWLFDTCWDRLGVFTPQERVIAYACLVEAVLNQWEKLEHIEREPYETDPIAWAAELAFDRAGTFREELRSSYNRLWRESPRPHGVALRTIALNSRGQLPISRNEVGLLAQAEGWSAVAKRLRAYHH